MRTRRFRAQGQALLEVLVSLAVVSILGFAVISVVLDSLAAGRIGTERAGALASAAEGMEAARQIRFRTWRALSTGFHGVTTETAGDETRYAFSGANDTRGMFTRTVTVDQAQRDAPGNLVDSGGTTDPDTRRVASTVSWGTGITARSVNLISYLTHWNRRSWVETLKSEFNQGVLTDTEALDAPPPPTGNGSVRLRRIVSGSSSLNVKGAYNFNATGPSDGRDVAVSGGYAYLVTALGVGISRLYVIDVSTASTPVWKNPDGGGLNTGAKNYAVAVSGNYAYVATDDNNGELKVINVANPSSPALLPLCADCNLPGNADALSVAVDGSRLYVGTAANTTQFYVFDVSQPATPVRRGSLSVHAPAPDVRGISPAGNYVYLATTADAAEVVVVNVTIPSSPSVAGTENLDGASDATSLVVTANRAYVTRLGDVQFVVLNLSNPIDPSPLGSVSLGAPATDLAVSGTYAYVSTEGSEREFIRVNVSDPGIPALDGLVNLRDNSPARGVAFTGSCAYVATNGNDQELAIICGVGATDPLTVLSWFDTPVGSTNAPSVALQGTVAYLGTGDAFYAFDVSQPATPALLGRLSLPGLPAAGVHDIAVSGSYAYLATSSLTESLVIVDVSNPASLVRRGSYNAGKGGLSVAVYGPDLVFLGTDAEGGGGLFVVLNVSNPATPSFVGQATINASITDIAAAESNAAYVTLNRDLPPCGPPPVGAAPGGFRSFVRRWVFPVAYAVPCLGRAPSSSALARLGEFFRRIFAVRTAYAFHDTAEIQRVDVLNPASPAFGALFNEAGNDNGSGVVVSGPSIYLVTMDKFGEVPEFYILNYVAGPPDALQLENAGSALDIGTQVRGLAQHDDLAYLAVDVEGPGGFQVVDVTNHASPVLRNTLDLGNVGSHSVAVSGTYGYLAAHDPREFIIVKNIDSIGYVAQGTFASIPFDAETIRGWERIGWTADLNGGTVRFQVRWADPVPMITPTCDLALGAATYVGPNGDSNALYTVTDTIITGSAGQQPFARCFQWRGTLNGTNNNSPEVQDVTITFTP
ncbi:MAG: hypothetical protein G01um101438_369 [Parcubacteria group bacterium Gr01-1014_38]|nr:MAG: hypothetical protein G01um101438_369 [Parcubacteria group bacterium Gr01-1014_38]